MPNGKKSTYIFCSHFITARVYIYCLLKLVAVSNFKFENVHLFYTEVRKLSSSLIILLQCTIRLFGTIGRFDREQSHSRQWCDCDFLHMVRHWCIEPQDSAKFRVWYVRISTGKNVHQLKHMFVKLLNSLRNYFRHI